MAKAKKKQGSKKVELLTRDKAAKRFPDREYDTYDIQYLVTGSEKAVLGAMGVFVKVDSKMVILQQGLSYETVDQLDSNEDADIRIDVNKRKDFRVVVFEK